jgi:rubredoxin
MSDDPDTLVDLTRVANELQAVSLVAELDAHGIPARIFNLGIMQFQMPSLQPQRIMVRRADLEMARLVLAEFRESADEPIDWETIETGDRSPVTPGELEAGPRFVCAHCGYARDGLPDAMRCPECGISNQREEVRPSAVDGPWGWLVWLVVIVVAFMIVLRWVL